MFSPRFVSRAAAVGLLAFVMTLVGCYSRVALPTKSTPPAAKIYINFGMEDGLVESTIQNQQQVAEQADMEVNTAQLQTAYETTARQLEAQVRADVIKRKIGFPVMSAEADADLHLLGSMAPGTYGVVVNWQLIDVRSGAVVASGIANSAFLNTEQYADQIVGELLGVNVDQYAANTGNSPKPPGGGDNKPAVATGDFPASATDGANAYAVIIGIESYREDIPTATHAESDAKAFAAMVEQTLNVPPEHIRLLVGDRASRADIASAIEEWLPRNVRDNNATVYVFFSGHGAPDVETGDAYLVPYDADPAFLKTRGYSIDAMHDKLAALPAKRIYTFLDACFSGSGSRSVLAAGTRPLVPVKDPKAVRGVISMSASSASEATGAAQDAPHGLFTYHLLQAVSGAADIDSDTNVRMDEIFEYVSKTVTREARLQNRDQTPTLKMPKGMKAQSAILIEGLKAN